MFGSKKKPTEIEPREAARQVQARAITLVDVREADERRELAPAVDSLHIPVGEIRQRLGELPQDTPVAFVCRSGGRSSTAAKAALAAGVDARNVTGGMMQWEQDGAPTTRGIA